MKKKIWIVLLICLLIVLLLLLCKSCGQPEDDSTLPIDGDAQSWQGNQDLHRGKAGKEIAIPGFSSLAFIADQTDQKVNFFNPAENDCLFVFSLFVDDTLLWQSGYCPPGNGYYNIQLSEPLRNGKYSGILKIECYRQNGEQLNGARIPFDLTVED